MNRSNWTLFPLLCCGLFLLTSCFEVVEKLDLHPNGSGNFQFTVNMSRSKTRIGQILQMKTINGRPVPTRPEIANKVKQIEKALSACAGITQVSSKLDMDNFIASVQCSFDNVDHLNQAIRKVAVAQKAKPGDVKDNYRYHPTSGIFTRLASFSLQSEYDHMKAADKEIFDNASYTGIVRFDNSISASSNPAAKIAADKKAVMVRQDVLSVIANAKKIENTITLTK